MPETTNKSRQNFDKAKCENMCVARTINALSWCFIHTFYIPNHVVICGGCMKDEARTTRGDSLKLSGALHTVNKKVAPATSTLLSSHHSLAFRASNEIAKLAYHTVGTAYSCCELTAAVHELTAAVRTSLTAVCYILLNRRISSHCASLLQLHPSRDVFNILVNGKSSTEEE